MAPGYFILAVMGCDDAAIMCEEIGRRDALFTSELACMAETETALVAASDNPYPLLIAECRNVSPQIAQADADTAG